MAKIVTFGEVMIRLQPYNYERFVQADHLQFTFGGGEANVAVSLANYGQDAVFVTKLPAHAIGQAAVNSLRGCLKKGGSPIWYISDRETAIRWRDNAPLPLPASFPAPRRPGAGR